MARYSLEPIAPFPPEIDRRAFGQWLSGFADGESCFVLKHIKANEGRGGCLSAHFNFKLRADERPVLELIRSYWGCGIISRLGCKQYVNPILDYSVARLPDLANVVIPHFTAFPLRTRKAKDFPIWRAGAEMLCHVSARKFRAYGPGRRGCFPKWTEAEKQEFLALKQTLSGHRDFDLEAGQSPSPRPSAADIDRDAFAHWLTGFVDGEGCFDLRAHRFSGAAGPVTCTARFQINLRADDWPTLGLIQSFLGCGKLHPGAARGGSHPKATFSVTRLDDLASIIIPHFIAYPLRARKATDFPIWRTGVELIGLAAARQFRYRPGGRGRLPKWSDAERQEFLAIKEALAQRRVCGMPPDPAVDKPTQQDLFD